MVKEEIRNRIISRIADIEKENEVKILFAIESGSRAWGFSSTDSDYDIRFIFAHNLDWYLSIKEKRDVIEHLYDGQDDLLDFSGWDIRKALLLFLKSNPPLLEWIKSPIIYSEKTSFRTELKNLEKIFFSPKSCLYHYLHMARGNYRKYLKLDIVRVKKYFYVLRPILACAWIEKYHTAPPIEFIKLVETLLCESPLETEIKALLNRKINGEELTTEPAIDVINDFIENRIEYYTGLAKEIQPGKPDTSLLDELFRKIIKAV